MPPLRFQVHQIVKGQPWRGPGGQKTQPNLSLHGVTTDGRSITLIVPGFRPYFYVALKPNEDASTLDTEAFKTQLQALMEEDGAANAPTAWPYSPRLHVTDISLQAPRFDMTNAFERQPFLRVELAVPNDVYGALHCLPRMGYTSFFESHIPYDLRYATDIGLMGAGWAEADTDQLRDASGFAPSTAELTYVARHPQVVKGIEGAGLGLAKMRVLSFDLETLGLDPKHHEIIQISAVECALDGSISKKHLFAKGTCDPIEGAEVHSFPTERALLEAFVLYLRLFDPQVVTGWNIRSFDLPFVIDRLKANGLGPDLRTLGVKPKTPTEYSSKKTQSNAKGVQIINTIPIPGRTVIDAMELVKRDNLPKNSLNFVSELYLKAKKDDVHYTEIPRLQNGNSKTRARLGRYCIKDSVLVCQIIAARKLLINEFALSQVTGVQLEEVQMRGQQHRIASLIIRIGQLEGEKVLMPARVHSAQAFELLNPLEHYHGNLPREEEAEEENVEDIGGGIEGEGGGGEEEEDEEGEDVGEEGQPKAKVKATKKAYQGATVLSPKIGFYTTPVATLDFASLYPSIMLAHNLCYSSILTEAQARLLPPSSWKRAGNNTIFRTDRKGVLQGILETLLAARKRIRAQMEGMEDKAQLAVLNGMQLACKVVANSVYGFTGTGEKGLLPCVEIASAVTNYGRQMIEATKATVESKFPGTVVVYGDTDSVMCRLPLEEVKGIEEGWGGWLEKARATYDPSLLPSIPPADVLKRAIILFALARGKEMADLVTQLFKRPIKLEFEKVYSPYLLADKKRYAGLYWTKCEKPDKLDVKGLETVRRDIVPFVANTLKGCLDLIIRHCDVAKAIELAKGRILQLRLSEVSLTDLIASKRLSDEYKAPHTQPHWCVTQKMKARDALSAPKIGDRVPFVVTTAVSKDKAAQTMSARAEDPMFVITKHLPLDIDYYFKCLEGPLYRLFSPILAQPTINARFKEACEHCLSAGLAPREFCDPCRLRYTHVQRDVWADKIKPVLFEGSHMQQKRIPPPVLGAESARPNILRYAVRLDTCVGCRTPIPPPPSPSIPALCQACLPSSAQIQATAHRGWMDALDRVASTGRTCLECAGSEEAAAACANKDCSIFYVRVDERERAKEASQKLKRLGIVEAEEG